MDSAHISPPPSLPVSMNNITTPQLLRHPLAADGPESTPSRQSRLLQYRNARFTGKRLSISKLERKLSLRGSRNKSDAVTYSPATYNKALSSKQLSHQNSASPTNAISSGILDNISNRQGVVENPRSVSAGTEESSGFVRLSATRSQSNSPMVYEHSPRDLSLSNSPDQSAVMRLREVSGNERRSPYVQSSPSPSSLPRATKRRSMPIKSNFDAENYIQHIEDELKQAKDAIRSPPISKSLQHQLKSATVENEKLRREISELRNAFETEVKSTIEHKAVIEVALRKKIRDLENDLDRKASTIKDLECQHEEKRLDGGTLETLRATIEKLEQEKASMENENRSMSKRNEVLSELLAFSPGKSRPAFELRSPTREKRPGRPLSLIIPRLPTSPNSMSVIDRPVVSTNSPALPSAGQISVLTADIDALSLGDTTHECLADASIHDNGYRQQREPFPHAPFRTDGTTSTLNADFPGLSSPAPFMIPLPSSPVNDASARLAMKRKPRKFMSGSTQLKPLLLPTLASDASSQASSSGIGSPGSTISRDCGPEDIEQESYFPPLGSPIIGSEIQLFNNPNDVVHGVSVSPNTSYVQYQTVDEILAEHDTDVLAEDDTMSRPASASLTQQTVLPLKLAPHKFDSKSQSHGDIHVSRGDVFSLLKADSASAGDGHGSSPRPVPHSHHLDWLSINQTHLHQSFFEDSSSSAVGSDTRILNAVPEPLFSPLARRSDPQLFKDLHDPRDGQLPFQDHRPLKRRPSRSSPGNFVVPTNSTMFNRRMLFPSNQLFGRVDSPLLPVSYSDISFTKKQSSSSQAATCIRRSRTPLEIIQNRQFGARPLAMMTIRTICTTISQCTSFVHDLKQDPWALARRVIANAWFANWRQFGRLSWWVLGLFLPQAIQRPVSTSNWDWDEYDGDAIAQRCCEEKTEGMEAGDDVHDCPATTTYSKPDAKDYNQSFEKTSDKDQKPGWCKSVFLWGKFSFAIMLAVGGAVVKGPAEMLKDTEFQRTVSQQNQNGQDCTLKSSCMGCARANEFDENQGVTREIKNSRQGRSKFDEQPIRLKSTKFESSHLSHQCSSPSQPFTFRSPRQLLELQTSHHAMQPPGDQTLRPAKSRKRYVGDLFDQTDPLEHGISAGVSNSQRSATCLSRQESVDEGILNWPPSPDFIRPEDSVSLQNG